MSSRISLFHLGLFVVALFILLPFSSRFMHKVPLKHFLLSRTSSSPPETYTAPPPHLPSSCHLVGHDPNKKALWQHNSRAFCLTSAVCIRPNTRTTLGHLYFGAPLNQAVCSLDNPDFTRANYSGSLDCSTLHWKRVLCAHGRFANKASPQRCPLVSGLSNLSETDVTAATWIARDRVAIVIPAFPWMTNIYHFSYVAGHLAHVLSELGPLFKRWRTVPAPRRVTLVFREKAPAEFGAWQAAITSIIFRRQAAAAGIEDIAIHVLNEDPVSKEFDLSGNSAPVVCAHAAVMLGRRGRINLWPFPNSTAISLAGDSVPLQAVALRKAVYAEFGIQNPRLPSLLDISVKGLPSSPETFGLPPLVIGYARRQAPSDPKPGKKIGWGWRRFSDEDEAWLRGMLHEEAARVGGTVQEMQATATMPFREQARWFSQVGFVVGIHGANLVNAMFAPPFGALLEITPGGHVSNCYDTGGNAGLAFFLHEAAVASKEESICLPEERCWRQKQHRKVKIEAPEHRRAVREKVRMGLAHLKNLHARFPSGIPVRLQLPEQRLVIHENQSM